VKFVRTLLVAGAALAAPAMVHAADLITVPTSGHNAVPISDGGTDWSGFYAGIYGIGRTSPVDGGQFGAGVNIGVNAQFDFVLVGGEIDVHGLVGGIGDTAYLQGVGKAGVALTDNLILYAAGGAGIDLTTMAESDALLGGGVELALTDDVSVDARYLHGFPLTGANPKDQVTVGANFHF
jgi:outer membrane immunogenic protein